MSLTVTAKDMLAIVRKAHRYFFHFTLPNQGSHGHDGVARLTAEISSKMDGPRMTLDIPASCRRGYLDAVTMRGTGNDQWEDYSERYSPAKGFCHPNESNLRAVLESLPSNALVSLEMRLDSQNNQYVVRKRLHADALYLVATIKRGEKEVRREFLIDVSIVEHNSARFGQEGCW